MLNQYAVKTRLKIGMFRRTALDRKESGDLAQAKNADVEAIKVSKVLLPDSAALKSLRQLANQIRKFHYENTLPWDDGGYRMLPNDHYTEYDKKMKEFERKFETLRAEFKKKYQDDIDSAKQLLGTMFNSADYPDVTQIDALCYHTLSYDPIPNDADFRVTLPAEKMKEMREGWRAREKQILVDANKHLWERFHDIVAHANDKLSKEDATFHYTLPQSLADFKKVLGGLNITDDQLLDQLAEDAARISEIPIKDLREDPDARKMAAEIAENTLAQVSAKMESFVK